VEISSPLKLTSPWNLTSYVDIIVNPKTPLFVFYGDNKNTLKINVDQLFIERINYVDRFIFDFDQT
jgi:hypothetical protein